MAEQIQTLEELHQLELNLNTLAPKLAPNCASVTGTQAPKVLEQLYAGEGSSALLMSCSKLSQAMCPTCGGPMGERSFWDFEWEVELAKRRMKPSSSCLICEKCAEIRDLLGLIKRLCFAKDLQRTGSEQSALLRHFLSVNGHDAANSHYLQDAVSLAYAIFTLRKELKLVPSRGPPLQELIGKQEVSSRASNVSGKKRLLQPPSRNPKDRRCKQAVQ